MKTIIEMAREAGLHRTQHNLMSNPVKHRYSYDGYEENLERFAELVRADERERTWVGLSAEDRWKIIYATEQDERTTVMELVEAKLKDKNT